MSRAIIWSERTRKLRIIKRIKEELGDEPISKQIKLGLSIDILIQILLMLLEDLPNIIEKIRDLIDG